MKLIEELKLIEAKYIEVQSDLFRESGVNATTNWAKISKIAKLMKNGWGSLPPIHGTMQKVLKDDIEDYEEAEERGYEHELAWSRPLKKSDIGKDYVSIDDGHNRAYAARKAGIKIRVKVW